MCSSKSLSNRGTNKKNIAEKVVKRKLVPEENENNVEKIVSPLQR